MREALLRRGGEPADGFCSLREISELARTREKGDVFGKAGMMDGLFFCKAAKILPGARIRETFRIFQKAVSCNLLLFAGTEKKFGTLKFHKKLLDF